LQAHPFTIASAAPAGDDTHAWFNLLIRSHSGFTQDLLHHAMRHNSVGARVEGPYGSSQALDTLHAADEVILVAGGSGIAVVFPAAWALLMDHAASAASATPAKRVHLVWIMHSDEHRHWVPSHLLDDLVAAGLDLVIPPATAVAGRPDVDAVVGDWLDDAGRSAREVAVMVSGPDGLNRQVRNTAARRKAGGVRVNIEVEKFGW
jgi:NAD(P)H-flavin reductase